MKNLTLIMPADVEQALADMLRGLKQVQGFTFAPVEGHGAHADESAHLSARDRVVGYVPYVRVDIVLDDKDLDEVLEALRHSQVGLAGRGRYWITKVERLGQL